MELDSDIYNNREIKCYKRKFEKYNTGSNLFNVIQTRSHIPTCGRHPIRYLYDISSKEALLKRFQLDCKLESHIGCVNTINWSSDGKTRISNHIIFKISF